MSLCISIFTVSWSHNVNVQADDRGYSKGKQLSLCLSKSPVFEFPDASKSECILIRDYLWCAPIIMLYELYSVSSALTVLTQQQFTIIAKVNFMYINSMYSVWMFYIEGTMHKLKPQMQLQKHFYILFQYSPFNEKISGSDICHLI